MSTGAAIVLDHVSKWFRDVVAVSDVSFTIGQGVTALLGPNGAGKSTIMRVMCGLAKPSQGTVTVLGGDPRRDLSLLGRIGLVPQQEALFESLTAWELVVAAAELHGLREPGAAAARALGAVQLDPNDTRPARTLSKGTRQRVKIAMALVHDPEVLVLDEPLTGLDPRQRLSVINLVTALGREGRCVVVSSHVLEEVERFGSRVLVLAQGRLAAEGEFRAIRALMDDRPHRLRVETDAPAAVAAGLIEGGHVVGAKLVGTQALEVEALDAMAFRRAIARAAAARGARLYEVVPLDDDLEAVFRYLVGR